MRRVDNALGLLLELPLSAEADGEAKHQGKKKGGQQGVGTEAAAAAGYVHISNVSDSRVEKLDKVGCLRPLALCTCGGKLRGYDADGSHTVTIFEVVARVLQEAPHWLISPAAVMSPDRVVARLEVPCWITCAELSQ